MRGEYAADCAHDESGEQHSDRADRFCPAHLISPSVVALYAQSGLSAEPETGYNQGQARHGRALRIAQSHTYPNLTYGQATQVTEPCCT